ILRVHHQLDPVERGAGVAVVADEAPVGDLLPGAPGLVQLEVEDQAGGSADELAAVLHADLSLWKVGELAQELRLRGALHPWKTAVLQSIDGGPVLRHQMANPHLSFESSEVPWHRAARLHWPCPATAMRRKGWPRLSRPAACKRRCVRRP